MMKRDLRFSRRHLLQAIGAGAALLPLLEADRADALCLAGGIQRMYILVWPEGMLSGTTSWAAAGDDPTSWTLPPFQSSLQPYMSDLLLLDGIDYRFILDMPGAGERTGKACFPGMLTGAFYQTLSSSTAADVAGGPSVDQYIGSALVAGGYGGLVSLNQGVFVQSTGRLSWKAAGQSVFPNSDPYNLYTTYFAGQIPTPTADAGAAPAPMDNAKLINKSILDDVMSDLNRFSNIVGTADKQSIDAHLTAVREMERLLQVMPSNGAPMPTAGPVNPACNPQAVPAVRGPLTSAGVPMVAKVQMDVAVAAFASDLTRCIVMQIGDQAGGQLVPTWLVDPNGVPYAAGGPNPVDANTGDVNSLYAMAKRNGADLAIFEAWFQSQVAYIVGQLKSVVDVTGKSLLDNSVVVAMSNMRSGAGEVTGVPVVMAGSCGGYFKTGRSLALPAGTANNGLLVALCNAMGTPTPSGTFGEPTYGGELTALKS
ncbi:MAG TPA: DUF1552 domain-containing protein [Polyangiaceae bacterium]|nr:DUF1552 domain-containing protein [Polyangiaceae bacterium]